jgi:dTMP kinase
MEWGTLAGGGVTMAAALERLRGKFVVFDGPDGSGKGTQIAMLADALRAANVPVVLAKDPGGTAIGDQIRHVLLDYDLSKMDVRCETFLFMASRAQLAGEVIRPALARGETVLCDRFISATVAYQGAAGFDPREVIEVGRHAVGETWPDLTIILDLPPEVGFERTGRRAAAGGARKEPRGSGGNKGQRRMFDDVGTDAMEARPLEFHQRVRQMFRELERVYPRPVVHIDAVGTSGEVYERILKAIDRAAF